MIQSVLRKKDIAVFYLLVFLSSPAAQAAEGVTVMKEVMVTAEKDLSEAVQFLPDIEGAKVYVGKKTSVVNFDAMPAIVNSNYRQVFEKTSGLLLSEESTPLVSLGYRGLNPDRAQYMQVMKDGIPIVADLVGYPEAYYTPPSQVVDHIDFVRGGSALMYGPQPGGALNFVTKDPYPDAPFYFESENSVGSHDFFSDYTSISGTQGPLGYYGYVHHRQSQGFRDFNSQYDVYYGGAKFMIEQDPTARWTIALDLYNEEHGEPGGLTRSDFDVESTKTTRPSDHFELNRYGGSVGYEKEISESTFLDWKLFGSYYERLSWRQRGGGFGTLPVGANASTNDIQSQEFYTGGTDLRVKHEYSAFGSDEHVLTGGVFYYHSTSPRIEKRGAAGDALNGVLRKDSNRHTNYASVFVENLFKFWKLSVTPGVRLENIWQSIQENRNADKTTAPLADDEEFDFVPIFGIGANLELAADVDLYANYSESYRPKVYADAVPLGTNQVVSGDLEAGDAWQAEVGLRGQPVSYLAWDVSLFYMEFNGQTGTVGNTIRNVGNAEYAGLELATELDLIGGYDSVAGTGYGKRIGALKPFYNLTLLDAEFVKGPAAGNIPQYAPDFTMKGGVEYTYLDKATMRFGGTFLDGHFGDDSNLQQRMIPSYKVWDLTAEVKVWKDAVSVFGGVNNVFNEHYFARVTGSGIDPADGRNCYGGVKVIWG